MIYFIIITNKNSVLSNSNLGQYMTSAVHGHSTKSQLPSIANEAMTFMFAGHDLQALKEVKFKEGSRILLCLLNGSGYNSSQNHLDLNNIDNTMAVFNYLKEVDAKTKLIISPIVVYV